MSTFVTIGNAHQPFSRLLLATEAISSILPQPIIVQSGHTPFRSALCRVEPFLPLDKFTAQMRDATLVIMHAGAGSILQALDAGRRPVVMPRRAAHNEHVDDHQVELAGAFAARELVYAALESTDLASQVHHALSAASVHYEALDRKLLGRIKLSLAEHAARLQPRRPPL